MRQRAQQLEHAEAYHYRRADKLECHKRQYHIDQHHQRHHGGDGRGVSQCYGRECAIDSGAAAFLQAKRNGEQPAHRRVDAVICAKRRKRQPWGKVCERQGALVASMGLYGGFPIPAALPLRA